MQAGWGWCVRCYEWIVESLGFQVNRRTGRPYSGEGRPRTGRAIL